jgi:hypothetical protein
MHKQGKFRGDKLTYPDGIGCCIWMPIDEEEDRGICFDFDAEDIDDMIYLLIALREAEAEEYKP